jgi:glycine cleavage system H protein
MVVILVAILFVAIVTFELVLERRRRRELDLAGDALHEAAHEAEPRWVAGYQLPPSMHFHQGHTWVHWVSPKEAYIGVDDFGRRLLSKVSKVKAPAVGAYVTQGDKAVKVACNGKEAELLSPLSGEVVGINPRLKDNPDLLFKDSYGSGWIYKVRSPHLFKGLSNLLHGSLAERWMEDTRDRFQHRLMLATGSVMQDGGTTVENLADYLDDEQWDGMVDEFLLGKEDVR